MKSSYTIVGRFATIRYGKMATLSSVVKALDTLIVFSLEA
jgi:hypothetical protein